MRRRVPAFPRQAFFTLSMNPKRVLHGLLIVTLLDAMIDPGAASDAAASPWILLSLGLALLSNFLGFYWYRLDSEERRYRRSRWMSSAIVTAMPFAMPYYLVRSRPKGRKLRSLSRFVAYLLLMLGAAIAGAAIAAVVGA